MDERTGRKPRARDRAWDRLRELLGLYPAFRPLALFCLRLCVRRLSREFALWRLSGRAGWFRRTLSRDACGGRHETSFRIARAIWTRRARSRLLADRAEHDRGNDRRSRRFGSESVTRSGPLGWVAFIGSTNVGVLQKIDQ